MSGVRGVSSELSNINHKPGVCQALRKAPGITVTRMGVVPLPPAKAEPRVCCHPVSSLLLLPKHQNKVTCNDEHLFFLTVLWSAEKCLWPRLARLNSVVSWRFGRGGGQDGLLTCLPLAWLAPHQPGQGAAGPCVQQAVQAAARGQA